MKIAVAAIVSLVLLCLFTGLNCQILSPSSDPGRAIQIVTPINHTFHLQLDELKGILEADPIKDRHVVVISIAGSFRKGKSFLLNFFIRFLDAQYKKHDLFDWMGETSNANELTGFKWRGGRKPETTGIWMWSQIYTHDFENGEKVAIVVLDTQGIFDSRNSVKDNAVTFALSTMLSSVQCYNVMSNIQEDDLNNLEMFSEYARLLYEQSNEKPFQNLLFIVRDWPYGDEYGFGWNGQKVVDEVLSETDELAEENVNTRQRIKSSFKEISGYLMPHPGFIVAQSKKFTGNLQQIQPEFRDSVKELASSLLTPENLIVKQVNGRKLRARDIVQYAKSYVDIFNGNTLPEPKTVFMATAEISNMILNRDCLALYEYAMQNTTNDDQMYYNSTELEEIHQQAKNDSLEQFDVGRKLGDDEFISSFRQKLENAIEEKFASIVQANDDRRVFIENTKYYEKLNTELKLEFGRNVCAAAGNDVNLENLLQSINSSIQDALTKFDFKKLNDDKLSFEFRSRLSSELANLQNSFTADASFYSENLGLYNSLMLKEIKESAVVLDANDIQSIHQNIKEKIVKKFIEFNETADDYFASCFQEKLKTKIESIHSTFQRMINQMQMERVVNAHNDDLVNQLVREYDNSMGWEVGRARSWISADQFWSLHERLRREAMHEFHMKRMGNYYSDLVNRLENRLDYVRNKWKLTNDQKKATYVTNESMKGGALAVIGGIIGGLVGGPPGAMIGAAAAGSASASWSYYKS